MKRRACAVVLLLIALVGLGQFPVTFSDISHHLKMQSTHTAGYNLTGEIKGSAWHVAFYPPVSGQPVAFEDDAASNIALPQNVATSIYVTFDDGSRDAVTYIEFDSCRLSGDITQWFSADGPATDYPNLAALDMDTNAGLTGDISGWTDLPSTHLYLNSTSVSGDISAWSNITKSAYLYLSSTSVSGDISGWTDLPDERLYLYNTSVSGDISGWTDLPSTSLRLDSTSVSGDMPAWDDLAKPSYLYLHTTSVSGDISGWTTLPSTYLSLNNTSVSGDISGWTNLPSTYLYLFSTSVSGDISGWTDLPSSYLHLYNTSVEGDISQWSDGVPEYLYLNFTSVGYASTNGFFAGCTDAHTKTDLDDCSLTETECDYILVDLEDSGAIGNTLDLAGTGGTANASPSALGMAAWTNLVADGWTITTNFSPP